MEVKYSTNTKDILFSKRFTLESEPPYNSLQSQFTDGRHKPPNRIRGTRPYDEAQEILKTTRYWDFTLDKERVPRCKFAAVLLLEPICSSPDDSREVAA